VAAPVLAPRGPSREECAIGPRGIEIEDSAAPPPVDVVGGREIAARGGQRMSSQLLRYATSVVRPESRPWTAALPRRGPRAMERMLRCALPSRASLLALPNLGSIPWVGCPARRRPSLRQAKQPLKQWVPIFHTASVPVLKIYTYT
jgi:hypothetical protein